MSGQLTISGMSAGEPAGERIFGPITIVGKAIVPETLAVELKSGDNTFAVPLEATAVFVIMPVNGEAPTKFRTSLNSGDAGLPLNPGPQPFVYVFPEPIPTSLIFHAETATGVVTIAFI